MVPLLASNETAEIKVQIFLSNLIVRFLLKRKSFLLESEFFSKVTYAKFNIFIFLLQTLTPNAGPLEHVQAWTLTREKF